MQRILHLYTEYCGVMLYDLVISGKVVDPVDGVYNANIGIKNGIITKITTDPLEGRPIALPNSSLIFPGFIDPHVHLRQDMSGKWNYKEDFITGSQAAAHGGLTTVADMPNNPIQTPENIMEKIRLSRGSLIDIIFYGGVSKQLNKLKALSNFVCGYKIYAEETTIAKALELNEIEKAVKVLSDLEKPIVFHAGEKLKQILAICENYPARIHIAHVATKNEIDLIEKYKKTIPLTCEATPHHIFFSEKDNEKLGKFSTVNPPLASEKDKNAVLDALKTGSIDMLATDHAPHTIEDKNKGEKGMPELDTYSAFVSWLINNKFDLQRIAEITAYNPAKHLGLNDRGTIQQGLIANLTVIDMNPATIDKLYTKSGWSPFIGLEFPGKTIYTIHQGKVIMKKSKILF